MTKKKGFDVLHDGTINKSVAFTKEERQKLGLRGLLPHSIASQDIQVIRVMDSLSRKESNIERYIHLSALLDRNEKLFYRVIMDHIDELIPIIYTPTVGQACKEFSHIYRRPKGFYITPDDAGEIDCMLDNWPKKDIRVIVITDGQRILGLGDLGANGMGIPIGKLELYTACAGIPPHQCLPVMLDVGTNNQELLDDILYLGFPYKRIEGQPYADLVEEFVAAVQKKFPLALIQFEDFLTPNAYSLLEKYKNKVLSFNDDIQGTGAVALAGVYASSRITGIPFSDSKILFVGAGSAATGIADLMICAFIKAGLSKEEAYQRLWFVDVNGLVVSSRKDLMEHNLPYAHDFEHLNLVDAIDAIQPNILIGATGASGSFTEEVVKKMATINKQPVLFALSNPTSKTECTAKEAYTWSNGKALFASGSPFDKLIYDGKEYRPAQANNAYVFPGIGLGVTIAQATNIPDELFLVAAKTLADLVTEDDIRSGSLYPRLNQIRNISLAIGEAVAEKVYELGLARNKQPKNLKKFISDYMYNPHY